MCECPICFNKMKIKTIVTLPCKHSFCRSCSKKIDICAICRAPFKDDIFEVYTKKLDAYRKDQDEFKEILIRYVLIEGDENRKEWLKTEILKTKALKQKIYREMKAFIKVLDRFDDDDVDNCKKWAKMNRQFNDIYVIQRRHCVELNKAVRHL